MGLTIIFLIILFWQSSVLTRQRDELFLNTSMIEQQLFFELIRVAIGTQDTLLRPPSAKEWQIVYDMAKKQSLVGICFVGIQKLVDSEKEDYCGMGEMQYLTWMGMTAKIQQRNDVMNGYTAKTLEYFRSKGFPCTILKGQGIARLYGDLAGLRQSGDVDVWVNCSRDELLALSKREHGKVEGLNNMYHCHYPIFDDCEVEAHFLPATIHSPFKDRAFKKFCKMYVPQICDDVPSMAFNRVYIMLHGFHHLVGHGCGLRQLLDYYFVLKQGFSEEERIDTMMWVERLGMKRYAPAMMWVMEEVFGLEERYLLCGPNEEDGRFMLDEVMETGNMGHGDIRYDRSRLNSAFGRFVHNLKRDWHMLRISQSHALWDPVMDVYQFVWKKYQTWKWNKM